MKLFGPRLFTSSSSLLFFSFFKPFTFSPLSIQPNSKLPLLRSHRCSYCLFFTPSSPVKAKMSTSPLTVDVKEHIVLTEKEEQIFKRLLEVTSHFNLKTQLRVAGGWVRDKLLGKECYDIDIALDSMLGREFCEKVNEYMTYKGEEVKGIGVINSNPDQSKHLETATMHIFGTMIDFVNLRSEDYCENSRIPTMRFGTPEEDAFRRDLTINSLFYNINTDSIEDFTGRGITDLRSGKIVTPLPPKKTFLDDPLRVLRAIRFGSRFGFELDGELKIAAADSDVKNAIADKISRERIGHEVDRMISGTQPVLAAAYMSELQLFWAVFSLPPEMELPILEGCERDCVDYMDSACGLLQLLGPSFLTDNQRRLCLYGALLLPFRSSFFKDRKGKMIPVVSYIFKTSLKLKNNDAEDVVALHDAAGKLSSLIPAIISREDLPVLEVEWKQEMIDVPVISKLRILVGLVMREIKELWRIALVVCLVAYPVDIGVSNKGSCEQLKERKEILQKVEKAIVEMGLDGIWDVKPLLNGKEIMKILELETGGPLVKEWQQKLWEWQLSHPSATAQECLDWMAAQTRCKRLKVIDSSS